MERPALVILAGPTAVGKTALSLTLAKELGAEIVGADSVQVYRGLDIGSAKPTPQEMAQVPHHLIDVADPGQEFNAARYAELAARAITGIDSRGRRALVTGGTGLYIKALLFGLAPAPPIDHELRRELSAQWDQQGAAAMHARLAKLDPEAASRLHPNDRQRVLRALEVCLSGNEAMSQSQQRHGFETPLYPHLYLGLSRPREELNQRIEERSRAMWRQGLLEETEALLAQGLDPACQALSSLGYRQAAAFLKGLMTQQQALDDMIKKTKAYAKRQMTWLRGVKGIRWFSPGETGAVLAAAGEFWS